ncbi:ATP-dependent Clp protease adaptor ClpS [Saccharothrix syringae]|uniref:ATP-dependent Clp protease adaptor ClpS n=1 Tax=Saccharothrix syringae TaxID=103733 RepID=UPI000527DB97|nr:ATP-dependent Clp protease adaptor ClpS [Saccharothrix syringae]
MADDAPWRVTLHDDEVNTIFMVAYLLRALCGLDDLQARAATMAVHRRGRCDVAAFPDQGGAERCAVQLQRFGLHATVGRGA